MSEEKLPTEMVAADLFSFIMSKDWSVNLHLTPLPLIAIAIIVVLVWFGRGWFAARGLGDFEIDGTELGVGSNKISFKPNYIDRQIAYSIWVEMNTRKIGLSIEIEYDLIAEVYDSWYSFFGVTRELVKGIPVSKARHDSTGKIIALSIEVLNQGLRPHLTQWQAHFRYWYEAQLEKREAVSPQELQKKFPEYEALCADLLAVNNRLVNYRMKMGELARGTKGSAVW